MKYFIIVLLAMLNSVLTFAQTDTTGLIVRYNFDRLNSNGKISNQVSNSAFGDATLENNAKIYNGVLDLTTGQTNGAQNNALRLPDNLTQNLTDFTISLWVKCQNPTTMARFFDFGSSTDNCMYLHGTGFGIKQNGSVKQIISMSAI